MRNLQLISNQLTGAVRRETHGGREYVIAPVVAVRAGVLNGALAPLEEIEKSVDLWNGVPVPLGHPKERGMPISANSPELETTLSVGRFWRAEIIEDRLRGEIWIDVQKVQTLEGQAGEDAREAMRRIEAGEGIEVSTAYFCDLEAKPGTFNGERYIGIQRNLWPDHLALLLHEIGACSWKDGCGVPRVNQKEPERLTLNQHTGVMVALFPPETAAASLAITSEQLPEGAIPTPANQLHMTMLYLGDLESGVKVVDQGELLRRVMNWAENTPIVRGMVSGVGRFTTTNEEGTQALFALYDCPYLTGLRYWLADWFGGAETTRGFIPHITLAYLPAAAPMPNVLPAPQEVVFDRVGVAWGDQVTLFPLQGEVAPMEANQASGFNPITLARSALRGLAGLFGFPTAETGPEAEPEQPTINQTVEVPMAKKDLVTKLAANKKHPFTQADLEAMSEGGLGRLDAALSAGGCSGAPAANAADTAAVESPAANAVATAAAELVIPVELQELSAALKELGGVAGLKSAVAAVQANADQKKADLVAELKANERCAFSEEELQAMPVSQLEKLASSLRPANYAGRGGPRGNAAADEHQVPAPPAIILSKPEEK